MSSLHFVLTSWVGMRSMTGWIHVIENLKTRLVNEFIDLSWAEITKKKKGKEEDEIKREGENWV